MHPSPSPSALLSPLLMAVFLFKCASREAPQTPVPSPRFPGSLPSPETQPALMTLGCSTQESVRVLCVQGYLRARLGPHVPRATWTASSREPLPPHIPLTHKPTQPASFGPSVYCMDFCCMVVFGSFPLSGGWHGGAPHAGLGTCPFPKAYWAPPSCSICVQRAKCPPLPAKKESPLPVKMVGERKKG